MQGRQNSANLERKGPHKSMHCKFCKPPGVVIPEKSTRPQLETTTKMHLAHEGADLKLFQLHDEPGLPVVEAEGCVCILEGEDPCPKCAPDKNRAPVKKKVCRCPKGAKPHFNMYDGTISKKKKQENEDDEFWWEKYSREHDALAKETWAAYMSQRRKEKKLLKCQKLERQKVIAKKSKGVPNWFQKLSCQQMIYVEFLSTAIRLDSDENVTDRTFFILSGIGLYPRPKRKLLKKCLRYCHYNSIRFLNQLHLLVQKEDPFGEKYVPPSSTFKGVLYSWNERLIMSSMCHLEFPAVLKELMDRLPCLGKEKLLPQIPYPDFSKLPKVAFDNPYEEPVWLDRLNWVEKSKINRLNRCRAHMITKRVKIPPLALVRRSSLIDARPPFLDQIEANERASRRILKEKRKQTRKYPVATFDSAIDVTAIANIEASEISTTDKADTDEICVFLREPYKEPCLVDEEEEENIFLEKEVKFLQEPETIAMKIGASKTFSEFGEYSGEEKEQENFGEVETAMAEEHLSLRLEPEDAEIDHDSCKFRPFVNSSSQTVNINEKTNLEIRQTASKDRKPDFIPKSDDKKSKKKSKIGLKLDEVHLPLVSGKKKNKKRKKKTLRTKNKCIKRKEKHVCPPEKSKKPKNSDNDFSNYVPVDLDKEDRKEVEPDEEVEGEGKDEWEENAEEKEEYEMQVETSYGKRIKKEKISQKDSESSDVESEDLWSTRPPCTPEQSKDEEKNKSAPKKRKEKKKIEKKNRRSIRERRKKTRGAKIRQNSLELREESQEYLKKIEHVGKADKETMTECYEGEYDHLYKEGAQEPRQEQGQKQNGDCVYRGNVEPLLQGILEDLADEGYVSAAYPNVHKHPDIDQLILHLKGKMVTKRKRTQLNFMTKEKWTNLKELNKIQVPELGLSSKKASAATWNDKIYISKLAKAKKDEFYFKIANSRAEYGKELYNTLYQSHFGTGRYLKIFCAYMTSKYEDAILRGID